MCSLSLRGVSLCEICNWISFSEKLLCLDLDSHHLLVMWLLCRGSRHCKLLILKIGSTSSRPLDVILEFCVRTPDCLLHLWTSMLKNSQEQKTISWFAVDHLSRFCGHSLFMWPDFLGFWHYLWECRLNQNSEANLFFLLQCLPKIATWKQMLRICPMHCQHVQQGDEVGEIWGGNVEQKKKTLSWFCLLEIAASDAHTSSWNIWSIMMQASVEEDGTSTYRCVLLLIHMTSPE